MNRRLEDYIGLPYRIEIFPDSIGDRRCYMARHPELVGCMAQGDTPMDALRNLEEARRDYITALLEWRREVPLPKDDVEATETAGVK